MIGSHKTSVSTPVIFRMFIGECIAFFPTEPGTNNPNTCANYTHVGQHGAGEAGVAGTLPATSDQYAQVLKELQSIGYNLRIVKRFHPAHRAERVRQLSC